MIIRGADVANPPPFLPPRRQSSLPNSGKHDDTYEASKNVGRLRTARSTAPFISVRHLSPSTTTRRPMDEAGSTHNMLDHSPCDLHKLSGTRSPQSHPAGSPVTVPKFGLHRTCSVTSESCINNANTGGESTELAPTLAKVQDHVPLETEFPAPSARAPPSRQLALRRSSLLRNESRLSEDSSDCSLTPPTFIGNSYSDTQLCSRKPRPYSHPPARHERCVPVARPLWESHGFQDHARGLDPWKLPALPPSRSSSSRSEPHPGPRPKRSLISLSSLDNLLAYREKRAEWERASASSSMSNRSSLKPVIPSQRHDQKQVFEKFNRTLPFSDDGQNLGVKAITEASTEQFLGWERSVPPHSTRNKFRHFAAEIGFCFTIAMTQFLAEYLISGFALELPKLLNDRLQLDPGSMGAFWPASLLSLILSATLLIWARLSDMLGGYFIFMFGVAWLAIWTLIPGFYHSMLWLDISRAMQGLAIAAFMPSTFSMVGSIYPEGPRRNFVMGLYSGCAPLGFFGGFLVAGALPDDKSQWYFFAASGLSLITFVTAFLSVPADRTDRRQLGLKMDWIGSFLIMSGLILVSYALAVEPYANRYELEKPGFAFPIVFGPFASGIVCLAIAFWYEGWYAACPLLPFEFFKPKSVKAFSLACLCFYASYGVWLYNSAQYFQGFGRNSGSVDELSGITLALWYTPTAIGGIILCIVGGSLMHVVPIMVLLLISALAWIAAPLLLALAPLPLHYWSCVVPSMLCATAGIDLTFTISIVFLSSVQPLRYQGLSGAVCSILVNLAMSFALSISEIVMEKAETVQRAADNPAVWGFRAAFIYAAASAAVGLLLCMFFVRISRSVVREQPSDEERLRTTASDSTLVGEEGVQAGEGNMQGHAEARQQEA